VHFLLTQVRDVSCCAGPLDLQADAHRDRSWRVPTLNQVPSLSHLDASDSPIPLGMELCTACLDICRAWGGIRMSAMQRTRDRLADPSDFHSGEHGRVVMLVLTQSWHACRYFLVADTIAHEMTHLWCGDLVTMTWWSDLWLNVSPPMLLFFFQHSGREPSQRATEARCDSAQHMR
jgi:hypothetical protein